MSYRISPEEYFLNEILQNSVIFFWKSKFYPWVILILSVSFGKLENPRIFFVAPNRELKEIELTKSLNFNNICLRNVLKFKTWAAGKEYVFLLRLRKIALRDLMVNWLISMAKFQNANEWEFKFSPIDVPNNHDSQFHFSVNYILLILRIWRTLPLFYSMSY